MPRKAKDFRRFDPFRARRRDDYTFVRVPWPAKELLKVSAAMAGRSMQAWLTDAIQERAMRERDDRLEETRLAATKAAQEAKENDDEHKQ